MSGEKLVHEKVGKMVHYNFQAMLYNGVLSTFSIGGASNKVTINAALVFFMGGCTIQVHHATFDSFAFNYVNLIM